MSSAEPTHTGSSDISSIPSTSRPSSRSEFRGKKRKNQEDQCDELLQLAIDKLNTPRQNDPNQAFINYAAIELSALHSQNAAIVKKLFSEALFLAKCNMLKVTDSIKNE